MSHNVYDSQQAIFTYAKANINWPIYTGGVEEATTLAANNGVLEPHIIFRFGSTQPYLADASFGGARYDGAYTTVDALCVAAHDDEARMLASGVTDVLLGFRPDANSSELSYAWGGGTFAVISEGSRPQFTIAWASFRFMTNLYDVG